MANGTPRSCITHVQQQRNDDDEGANDFSIPWLAVYGRPRDRDSRRVSQGFLCPNRLQATALQSRRLASIHVAAEGIFRPIYSWVGPGPPRAQFSGRMSHVHCGLKQWVTSPFMLASRDYDGVVCIRQASEVDDSPVIVVRLPHDGERPQQVVEHVAPHGEQQERGKPKL